MRSISLMINRKDKNTTLLFPKRSVHKRAVQRAFSSAAETYDSYALLQRETADRLLQMLTDNEKVGVTLDVGSGTGFLAIDVARKWPESHAWAVDIAHGMSMRTMRKKRGLNNLSVITADVEHLPFSCEFSTTLLSNLSLQWSIDLPSAVHELMRVLRKSGCFFIAILTNDSLPELKKAMSVSFPNGKYHAAIADTFHDIEYIKSIFAQADVPDISFSKESWVRSYKNAFSFLNSIKQIGATPLGAGRKSIGTYREVKKLLKYYDTSFQNKDGVQATYEVLFIKGKK